MINEIVRRHEALRTRFEVEEGEPVQVIDEWEPRRLEVEDLTSLPLEEREAEARRIAREEAGTGFDLSRGPLLRVKALEAWRRRARVALYHASHRERRVVDGDPEQRSRSALSGLQRRGRLATRRVADSVCGFRGLAERVAAGRGARKRACSIGASSWQEWKSWSCPRTDLGRRSQSYRGAGWRFVVEREVTEKLKRLSHREGATLFMRCWLPSRRS